MNIVERIRHEAGMWQEMGFPALLQEFVLRNGTVSLAQPWAGKRMPQGQCFRNAALCSEDGTYCEGYGWRKSLPILIHHAWRVDSDGRVVDRTWDRPEECQYMGVLFSEKVLMKELMRTKYYGLLDQGFGFNVKLMIKTDPSMAELLPDQLKRKFQKV